MELFTACLAPIVMLKASRLALFAVAPGVASIAALVSLTMGTALSAVLAARTALTLNVSFRLVNEHSVRELVFACLLVDLQELHGESISLMWSSPSLPGRISTKQP